MKRDKILSLRVTEDDYNYLANWSKNSNRPISEVIRQLIEDSKNPKVPMQVPISKTYTYTFPNTAATATGTSNIIWYKFGEE